MATKKKGKGRAPRKPTSPKELRICGVKLGGKDVNGFYITFATKQSGVGIRLSIMVDKVELDPAKKVPK